MGIVFSAKVGPVPEPELYTRENYFTGAPQPSVSVCIQLTRFPPVHSPRTCPRWSRLRDLLGRPHGRCMQPSLWRVGWHNWLNRRTRGCRGPKPFCKDSHRRGVWEYPGAFRSDQ